MVQSHKALRIVSLSELSKKRVSIKEEEEEDK
jgi:hypothetical protein